MSDSTEPSRGDEREPDTAYVPPPQARPAPEGSGGAEVEATSSAGGPQQQLEVGATVAGRFRIEALLGRGGMGEVYLAEDTHLERRVAIKVLSRALLSNPTFVQRFRREARAASSLTHPNVCSIHEVGETESGLPFMAMEFVEGQTLDTRLEAGELSVGEIVDILVQVADALDAVHEKHIVHRDLKPGNVSVTENGRAKLLDFGLAKRFQEVCESDPGGLSSMSTRAGTILGTPTYMSPEQTLGKLLDHRSDIFSFGAMAYQLLTGRVPFPGTNAAEIVERIGHAQPEAMARFNSALPGELERIVRKCLEKSPGRRYQSARELLVDLTNLKRGLDRAADDGPPSAMAPATADVELDGTAAALSSRSHGTLDVAETAPPKLEELRQSDVFLSFASIDDQPVVTGRLGWITQFQRNLKVRLEQLSGEPARIWRQANPLGSQESEEDLLLELPRAKTLVSVLSPPFVRSQGCRSQVARFWSAAEGCGELRVKRRPRVFKVVKSPVEPEDVPAEVAPLLSRLRSFEFFEWNADTGRWCEFDETLGELARQRFQERIYDLAYELREVLKGLRLRQATGTTASPEGKVVYLATTTADLAERRDQLQRELTEMGHEVIPRASLPVIAGDLEHAVRAALESADVAIHLIGDRYGLIPEDSELSVVELQNRIAAAASAAAGIPRFVWMPRDLQPRDERQTAFIRELTRDPLVHCGAEVIVDTLENFKVLLRSRWSPQRKQREAQPQRSPESPPRVYLICDPRDEQAIEALEDFFYDKDIEVSLPAFDVREAEAQKIHIRNLRDCDGALIFYGAAGQHWVDFNLRDLEKAAGYRGAAPVPVRAVYVAPPSTHRKERLRCVSATVIRPPGDALDPLALAAFAQAVATAKGEAR